MLRFVCAAGLSLLVLLPGPAGTLAYAVTAKDKMATCKFGADAQKLAGKPRADFLKKCMSSKNDPRGPGAAAPDAPPPSENEAEPKI